MAAFYELLDIESGMLLREFPTLGIAIENLRREFAGDDRDALQEFALLKVMGEESALVAMEDDLLKLVNRESVVLNQASQARAQTETWKPLYSAVAGTVSWQGSTSTTHRVTLRAA